MLSPVVAEVPEGETLTLHGGLFLRTQTARGDLPRHLWPPSRPQRQLLLVWKRLAEAGGVLAVTPASCGLMDGVRFLIPHDSLSELESHQVFGPRVINT